MAGADDVAADLEHGLSLLPSELITVALGHLRDAHALLAPLAATSGQPDIHQAAAGLSDVLGELERLHGMFASVRNTVGALVSHLIGPDVDIAPGAAPTRPAVAQPPPRTADTDAPRIADLMARLPVRSGSGQKTSGYWIDDDGGEHGPVVSGEDEDYEHAKEILRALQIGPPRGELFAASHVETKFAARLRDSERKRVTLVINKRPCDDGRFSCDRLLPRILRPDQEVTVYWPGGSGTYRGRRQ
ncbi:hypothetical protein [Alloactinosynnema sp. L-07]|uniref:DddA-like double-stranded DNA deaminase toxin n=1 Tax=Alloactinosynnema sp. L-07 TaxID=1653480 RepID=UPI00065EFD5F|nr:DddA-like double-stranded DNA deaminase toxin [Alloactinosynnema sp. L-07]CRK60362.1 hypothetical protein [Alloactinosynnema sp. L-07]